MGLLSQTIERSQLVVGDHIYTRRAAFAYSHHGIYIGECKVVHFTDAFGRTPGRFSWCSSCVPASSSSSIPSVGCPKLPDCGSRQPRSGVVLSCLDCFLTKGSLYRFDYGVPTYRLLSKFRGGTCTTAQSDPPEETSHRAEYLFQHGFGEYHVTNNNCEHFAMYCKTGFICTFGGIGQVPFSFMAAGAFGSVASLIPGVKMATMTAAAIGTYFASRYANDLGVRVEVMKVQVEDLVVSRGSVKPVHDDMASDEIDNENSGGNSNSEGVDTTISEEKIRDVQPVGGRSSSVASSIEEIIRELEQRTEADHANDKDETQRSYAQNIKDDFVNRLVQMDPLAPKDMIAFANSSLKLLSHFPIDVVGDTLYFSVKNFIVRAYEFASAKREVHSASVDFNTQLEETCERIRVLTEEKNRLQLLLLEADDFRSIQIDLEQNSRELSDASNIKNDLELATIFRSREQPSMSAHLDDLEAAFDDARAQLLSQGAS